MSDLDKFQVVASISFHQLEQNQAFVIRFDITAHQTDVDEFPVKWRELWTYQIWESLHQQRFVCADDRDVNRLDSYQMYDPDIEIVS